MTHTRTRILIVDDERQNRQLLEVLLAPEGYVLDTASSAEEAMIAVLRQRPDLILLDVMMPGMDGYQLVGRLKANADTATIPIVMLTALDDRNSRSHGLAVGAAAFLTKPVDRHLLSETVSGLLIARERTRTSDAASPPPIP
ncbi:MAG: response regulator [bacterium]